MCMGWGSRYQHMGRNTLQVCKHDSLEEEEGEDGDGETDEGDSDTDDPNDPQGECLSSGQLGRQGRRKGGS